MNKVMHNSQVQTNTSLYILILFSITALSGGILASSSVSADDSAVSNIAITVSASCTLSGTGQNSHNADINNGTYTTDIGTTTLKAFCNDSEGFAIYAIGYTGEEYGVTNLVGTNTNSTIVTGTATTAGNPDISNWAMKLGTISSPTPTYPITIDNGFSSYSEVPSTYTKVAHRDSGTDTGTNAEGSTLTTTYAAYISKTQSADTYNGKVKYTMVHPANETPLQPQTCPSGKICYFPNGSNVVGTMGQQSLETSDTEVTLLASNFSRSGYGFAGWSDSFDYTTNANANFYGPNEDISFTAGQYTDPNPGLSLYAVWIESAGTMQTDTSSVCNNLTASAYSNEGDSDESTWSITASLNSISALTDTRDGQTYAIAKLSDDNCWMIENLRRADKDSSNNDVILSNANTHNPSLPLTNIYDTNSTSNHLSPTSSVAYNAATAPEGWCTYSSPTSCYNQSRLRTTNTANRVIYSDGQTMSSTNANLYSYGNYYNWYSATAGNGTYSTNSNVTVLGDICPTGWHLPTGTGSGDFGKLFNSLGGYKNSNNVAQTMESTTTPTGVIMQKRIRHFPNNLLYSGFVEGGASLYYRGLNGFYWSSTASSNPLAYALYFENNSIYFNTLPGNNGRSKYSGMPIRCIATSP